MTCEIEVGIQKWGKGESRGIYRPGHQDTTEVISESYDYLWCPPTISRHDSAMPRFRFTAKYAMLTYSQVGTLDPTLIVRHIQGLGAQLVLGRESHQDGGTHFHAFIHFDRRPNLKRHDCFDVEGHHPNVSVTKGSPRAGYDYATKDGDIVHADFERPEGKTKRHDQYAEIIQSETREKFWENAEAVAPDLVLKSFISLSAFVKERYKEEACAYDTPEGYVFHPERVEGLLGWVECFLEGHTMGGK